MYDFFLNLQAQSEKFCIYLHIMRTYRHFYFILLAVLLAAGCDKTPVETEPQLHEFTKEELRKKKVDDAFSVFFHYLDLDAAADPWREVVNHSHISVPEMGHLRYTYVRGDLTLISMDVVLNTFKAELYRGIRIEGEYPSETPPAVYIDGEQVASLDFVWYEYRDSGKMNRQLVPVFRFDDGTTYAVSGILLVEPLIEFLLKNVLSTE